MSRVKCYNCKKEGHFAKDCKKAKVKDYEYYKTKMLLVKKDKDEKVLLAEDQAWIESNSEASSSSADEKIAEPDEHAQIWKNQRTIHGQAKIKSWKLLESCGVHIITFTTIQLILLVKRRYPLSRFTLDQMLNAVRLQVEDESENRRDLSRNTPLDRVEVLCMIEKKSKVRKGMVPNEIELVLEQTQQKILVMKSRLSDNEEQETDDSGMAEALAALEATLKKKREEPKKVKQNVNYYVDPYESLITFPKRLEHHAEEALVHQTIESLKKIKINRPLLKENRQIDNFAKQINNICDGGDLPINIEKHYRKSNNDSTREELECENLSLNDWMKIRYGKVCKMIWERILKDYLRESFEDEEDDLDKNLEDPEECEEDKVNTILGVIHDKFNDWFNNRSKNEDDIKGILDYLKPRSYDRFIDLDDKAYNKRRLVPSCFTIFDLEPLSLSFDFVISSEILKSLSFNLDRLYHLVILCLDHHAHTLHHLESLLTVSLDRLDILKEYLVYQSIRNSLSLCLSFLNSCILMLSMSL
uniref:CCHC-type domain-containing protein n=1 Tax=Tanacetum cinerariifolium TaxID=118510 RepID=A0A699GLK5_TANCI|nr:hypothetical protein [Tanacetum cinerariifolium]